MPAQVQVLTIALDQPDAVVAALATTLDEVERRAAAARVAPARERYVVAHGALRAILGDALDLDPGAIVFDRRCRVCGDPAHGKPCVAGAGDSSFNLSHSGDVAVVAILSGPHQVGVDIERRAPRRRLEQLAARTMTPEELERWSETAEADRLDAFLRTWTAKEAYLKATGLGLRRPLRATPAAPQGWSTFPITPAADVLGAVAVDTPAVSAPVARPWGADRGFTLVDAW